MKVLRTPDKYFKNIKDYPFKPIYTNINTQTQTQTHTQTHAGNCKVWLMGKQLTGGHLPETNQTGPWN